MNTVTVTASKTYSIHIGSNLLSTIGTEAAKLGKARKICIISETTVWPLYGPTVRNSLEDAGFALATNQVSEVIKTADGYYLLKCISTYDKEQTDANKECIIQQRKDEAFSQEYDVFVEKLSKKINEKLWNSTEFLKDEAVDTDDFFEVYEKYL